MKPISLTLHGAIDYLAVVIFVVAPAVIGLSGWPAVLSYALAGIHLFMTLLTDFPAGAIKLVPVALHKWVERIVGPVLIIFAFVPMNATMRGFLRGHGRNYFRRRAADGLPFYGRSQMRRPSRHSEELVSTRPRWSSRHLAPALRFAAPRERSPPPNDTSSFEPSARQVDRVLW